MSDRSVRIQDFYRFLWQFLAAEEGERSWLDEDIGGRPNSEFLLEIPGRWGVGPCSRVLDAGSGKGREACDLVKRFGASVIALDPLERNMELARERIAKEGLHRHIKLVRGSIENLCLADASVDFVWSRDAFNHVGDIGRAFAECARVLRPGGVVMNYSALATDWLEPREARRLAQALAINLDTLDSALMAAAIQAAGLRVVEHAKTTDAGPYYEELDQEGGRYLMRLATILAARERTIARIGPEDCNHLIGYYTWNVYFLIGKLVYGVWVLRRAAAEETR